MSENRRNGGGGRQFWGQIVSCNGRRRAFAAVEDQCQQRQRLTAGPQDVRRSDTAGANIPDVAETGHSREHQTERN